MPGNEVMEKSTDAATIDRATTEIQNYRRMVSDQAEAATGEVIFNHSWERAAIIVEYIFRKSQNEVDIKTRRLIEEIFGTPDLVKAAAAFLTANSGAKLNIVSEEKIPSTHPLLSTLEKLNLGKQVDLRVMTPELTNKVKYHLTVGDGRYFRFERQPGAHDVCDAVVQFGEAKIGKKLVDAFQRVQSQLVRTKS
jgi:hypothetical protein